MLVGDVGDDQQVEAAARHFRADESQAAVIFGAVKGGSDHGAVSSPVPGLEALGGPIRRCDWRE